MRSESFHVCPCRTSYEWTHTFFKRFGTYAFLTEYSVAKACVANLKNHSIHFKLKTTYLNISTQLIILCFQKYVYKKQKFPLQINCINVQHLATNPFRGGWTWHQGDLRDHAVHSSLTYFTPVAFKVTFLLIRQHSSPIHGLITFSILYLLLCYLLSTTIISSWPRGPWRQESLN